MLDQVLTGYVNAMTCEHRQIEGLVRRLEQNLDALSAHEPDVPDMAHVEEQLVQLEKFLTGHFQREEEGGFLDDAAVAAPSCAGEAGHLLQEHSQLLTRVRELGDLARQQSVATQADWQSFAAALRNALRQLGSHEQRENELLHRAFNVANGR